MNAFYLQLRQLPQDKLERFLGEVIDLFIEYNRIHGQTKATAKAIAITEVFEAINAEEPEGR
jgi:hypothetical protein